MRHGLPALCGSFVASARVLRRRAAQEVAATTQPRLLAQPSEHELHCALGDPELGGDPVLCMAVHDEAEDVTLAA